MLRSDGSRISPHSRALPPPGYASSPRPQFVLYLVAAQRNGVGGNVTGELGTAGELSGGAGVGGLNEKGHYCIMTLRYYRILTNPRGC